MDAGLALPELAKRIAKIDAIAMWCSRLQMRVAFAIFRGAHWAGWFILHACYARAKLW